MIRQWDRREVVLGGLLTIVPMTLCSHPAHADNYGGCWIAASDAGAFDGNLQSGAGSGKEELVSSSGVDGLEIALVQTLGMLSTMFGILPGFSYYRETGSPNARATSQDLLKNRPDGTVLLGLKLVDELLKLPSPDAAIVAVCAHEFAHILSYSNGMIKQLMLDASASPFRSEQFADFMAGYFAGVRKKKNPQFPAVMFAQTTGLYGGGTHGTREQRGIAVQEGFKRGFYAEDQPVAATQRAFGYAMSQPQT